MLAERANGKYLISGGLKTVAEATSLRETSHVPDRDYLTPTEANRVIAAAARIGRQQVRDQVLLRLIYRHGLRATEARNVKWSHLMLDEGEGPKTFHIIRLKDGIDSTHTLDRDEVAGLRKLKATSESPFVFLSERGGPISPDMIARIVERAAKAAGIGFHVHPHMLRHSAGHMLADAGHDTRRIQQFLGHRDQEHGQVYRAVPTCASRCARALITTRICAPPLSIKG